MQSTANIASNLAIPIPTGNNVLVRPDEAPDYKGTLIIPQSAKNVFPTTGTVEALGMGIDTDANSGHVCVGDRVVFSKYAGVELKFEDDTHLMCLKEEDILCILQCNQGLKEI